MPEGTGLIVRTAGAKRTKAEIKRDFDYLLRLWENIRDLTLASTAPNLVYEEGNLIKRSIRDLYSKEVDEVLVEGEHAYRDAKDFMKMIMPSHARNVKLYKQTRPLFSSYQVEGQLDSLFSPVITLRSGGYLVMDQTEALVAVDINSGKATREHNIEDTALKTNLQAAEEIARQLRLRDLAGLIVIDFIDMEERRNNRAVERRLKESLKNDRARIQVGRISHFGLLEMSRQRLRQSMLEGSTKPCSQCEGTGLIRSLSSCALSVLRSVEEHLLSKRVESLSVRCAPDVATYILNDKREHLLTLETAYGLSIFIVADGTISPSGCKIERDGKRGRPARTAKDPAVKIDSAFASDEQPEASQDDDGERRQARSDTDEEPGKRRRRRRRKRGGRRNDNQTGTAEDSAEASAGSDSDQPDTDTAGAAETGNGHGTGADAADAEATEKPKRARRARRPRKSANAESEAAPEATPDDSVDDAPDAEVAAPSDDEPPAEKPKRARRARKPKAASAAGDSTDGTAEAQEKPKKPARKRARKPAAKKAKAAAMGDADTNGAGSDDAATPAPEAAGAAPADEPETETRSSWSPPAATAKPDAPRRTGWWRRG